MNSLKIQKVEAYYFSFYLQARAPPERPEARRCAGPCLEVVRLGPALGEQDLGIPDGKSQIAGFTQLWTRPSVRCVPQLHGSMTLVERRRTIYFRTENSNVAEQEKYKGLRICSSRSDSAAHHETSKCASSQHQLRSPALSVPDMPVSQASSEVDVRRRSTSPSTTR